MTISGFILSTEVKLAQMGRRLSHVRRFNAATKNPRLWQERILKTIVDSNRDTEFGKRYQFDKIQTIEDYRKFVPSSSYEGVRPYVDAVMNGGKSQLTAQEPFMFASTSGTTAKPKFIPITELHLRDYAHAFQIHNYHLIRDYEKGASGKFLIISSNDEEGITENGIPCGAVSGLLNKRQPPVIRRHFASPYEICKIKNVDAKYYLMLRMALAQDVTAILCCNPSSLLLLSDQLRKHAQELVRGLHDGTIHRQLDLPANLVGALKPHLTKNVARAKELSRILDSSSTLEPRSVWPCLTALSCWKGGPMSFYLDQLRAVYGDLPIRDLGYMASEGRGSIPISDEGAGGVVAVSSHFFEFVREDDYESGRMQFFNVDELLLGQRYYIFFTTAAGLYRYDINDLVEVVGFHNHTPSIKFVRKGNGISSITGEKVTEEQVALALSNTMRELKLAELDHFTAEVELQTPPRYGLYAESSREFFERHRSDFERTFDKFLQINNCEYADKRESKRLGAPKLHVLPPGTYLKLRQLRVQEGAPEAQVKIPLLSPTQQFAERLATLVPGPILSKGI